MHAPNALVLLTYSKGSAPTNLHTHLAGPYRVTSNEGGKYLLYDFTTDKQFEVSVTRLKDSHSNDDSIDPAAIARKDKGEFLVESIQAHVGDLTRKSSLDFKVRWVGYTARDDEWLPWSALRNNPKLHSYLIQIGKPNLVPKEHRAPPIVLLSTP